MLYSAMTIAGSDSGGGAGIQADLKTFMNFKVYGTSSITAITAQNTLGVNNVQTLSPDLVAAQIDAVIEDIGTDAVKTGMLGSREVVQTVADRVTAHRIINLVVDPVMVSTSGHRLLQEDAIHAYIKELFPLSLVVTPNLYEAEIITGYKIDTVESLKDTALRMLDMGARWVLLKGGHRQFAGEDKFAVDLLTNGDYYQELRNPRIATTCTHGTGCTLSAAIAACLALGMDVPGAVHRAEAFLNGAIRTAVPIGIGHGPVNHWFDISN
ncbi:MAG TPA: bifunctional hydroxymethylpyrimidine kinase/phosphomethylpyrimidine kinase [Desulfotomaculum sp.]|nr:MAG: phosphomethylpyrimidine kinase [Peptococcaceae bacterium BRH_c8a]KJS75389.1 MAG: phosphomethylpyrimidine kinase [Desulfotomaculum sp. BICA1-6]HBX22176.1 bifunctional hydroxymethylpyrimidine kinase/phosphomethylpyrimidine kinase [Desulfotomaculum sp.]